MKLAYEKRYRREQQMTPALLHAEYLKHRDEIKRTGKVDLKRIAMQKGGQENEQKEDQESVPINLFDILTEGFLNDILFPKVIFAVSIVSLLLKKTVSIKFIALISKK